MSKITSKNNDFLFQNKDNTSAKVYSIMLDLVNEDREDLAKEVKKIDYLLEYTSRSIKAKDFREAKNTKKIIDEKLELLRKNNVDMEYLEYLYEGIKKKIK